MTVLSINVFFGENVSHVNFLTSSTQWRFVKVSSYVAANNVIIGDRADVIHH